MSTRRFFEDLGSSTFRLLLLLTKNQLHSSTTLSTIERVFEVFIVKKANESMREQKISLLLKVAN
jgi:hypothetical protein